MLDRRMVVRIGAMVMATAFSPHIAVRAFQVRGEDDETFVPPVPEATEAWMALASKLDRTTILDEPLLMLLLAIGFRNEEDAGSGFETVSDYYSDSLQADSPERSYRDISVGPLGDQRAAVYDNIDPDYAASFHVTVRLGRNVLAVQAAGFSPDVPGYVVDYLGEFLPSTTDEARSLIPDISVLPRGWSYGERAEPDDVLEEMRRSSGSNATPEATP